MPLAIQACHDEDGFETVQLTMPVIKCWQRYERMPKIVRYMFAIRKASLAQLTHSEQRKPSLSRATVARDQ